MKTVKAWAIVDKDGNMVRDFSRIAFLTYSSEVPAIAAARVDEAVVEVEIRAVKPKRKVKK